MQGLIIPNDDIMREVQRTQDGSLIKVDENPVAPRWAPQTTVYLLEIFAGPVVPKDVLEATKSKRAPTYNWYDWDGIHIYYSTRGCTIMSIACGYDLYICWFPIGSGVAPYPDWVLIGSVGTTS